MPEGRKGHARDKRFPGVAQGRTPPSSVSSGKSQLSYDYNLVDFSTHIMDHVIPNWRGWTLILGDRSTPTPDTNTAVLTRTSPTRKGWWARKDLNLRPPV